MAFVHLHNHSDYSMLDGATRIKDMVARAVECKMPAVALTDHGYMYGIPDLALETDAINKNQADYKQWSHDKEAAQKGGELKEPSADDAAAHAQWERDVAAHAAGQDLESVKPAPLIKPIFGCEVYFTPDSELRRDRKPELYHLILLAKNMTGYVNLMKIVSKAANEGFYYRPRVTLEMLQEHSEGLICTSACISGIIPRNIVNGNPAEALRWARTFKDTFAPGDFYLEIQEHGLTFENGYTDRRLSEELVAIAQSLGVKVIATNDFHYLRAEDAATQDLVMCIGTNSKVDDENRIRMTQTSPGKGDFYMKSEEEMRALFDWCPEACDNTLEIAEKCNVELEWGKILLPAYPLDPGETNESQFRRECEVGLGRRYGEDWRTARPDVVERFEYEYKIVCEKGFAAYFLIVQDYVRWAKEHGIGVGPGRGSAAGAIVAYAMDITTFDPLENGLLFERFLSPERTEMPDIDMDFDDERRLEVIQYVRERYGADHVTHVITYSTIKAKQAINDAARVLDYPVYMGQKLSKMISSDPSVKLKQVLTKQEGKEDLYSEDFADAYAHDEDSRRIIDAALAIEGLTRGEGVHACAVLIAPDPVNEHVPTKLDTKGGVEITQYEGHTVADMGLLKMDFLGLRTLTVISKALRNIKQNHGVDIDIDTVSFDDPKIFELLGSGHTAGVFQVESDGMTATIKSMQPRTYSHVVALIALYRPGPLGAGMVTDYIDRMNGRKPVTFYDDRLSDILNETYGTIVYQEQVMQISMKMSGFSAGESDKVRKAVAKKKIKLMQEVVQHWDDGTDETMEEHWMNGAVRNGYDRAVAEKIWADVLKFASYAFNKSHSAGYAILVMQTAWLKAHYRNEFMAAVLTSYTGKTDKIVHYVSACRHEGVAILPPDINESGTEFTATAEGVRFGLAGIRGVGEGVTELIIKERDANGPFKTLNDFVERIDAHAANRRVVESLIKAGAFDSTGYPRLQLMRMVDKGNPNNILDDAGKRQKDRASGQVNMFDLFADVDGVDDMAAIPDPDPSDEWDRHMKLAQEKDVLGIYVSDHPLRPYEYALAKARSFSINELLNGYEVVDPDGTAHIEQVPADRNVWIAGMVSGVRPITTKQGKKMATVTLEDMESEVAVVVFPKVYEKAEALLRGDTNEGGEPGDIFVRILGKLERGDRGDQLMAQEIEPLLLNDAANKPKSLEVHVPARFVTQSAMESMQRSLRRYPGLDRMNVYVEAQDGTLLHLEVPNKVDARNVVLFAELQSLVGDTGHVRLID